MRRLLPLLLLAACDPVAEPAIAEEVRLVLSTAQCEPDVAPEDHFTVADHHFDVSWETLCVRDRSVFAWQAVKVSLWDDRAEDAWNVWFVDPDVSSVRYGEVDLPGVLDPATARPPRSG